ncbi:DUF547 domain-containing protein [Fulvivirgaceae bacterium BMA10]|uniref:DUF547 domain-containing protein n=1 Tax=Splendidivirga corallicola TaxID=3051826 RepID=A0ABT8KXM2_9BACT|nr:DUF547 domain-containing protein [Fulvivirgaceae bacterium BMA10]
MKQITFAIAFLVVSLTSQAQGPLNSFTNDADKFFAKHVANGLVDYETIKKNPAELNQLVKKIEGMSVGSASESQKKAFYINSYNLLVINGIVQNYPTKSPLDIGGFFDTKKRSIAGERLTLNDIENKKLRETTKDSRVHFVLVCAALGCPKITNFAYKPATLDAQLDRQTKLAINDPNFIRVKDNEKKVYISEIFKWYTADFTNESKTLLAYLNRFKNTKVPNDYKVDYYTYDWALNKKKILNGSSSAENSGQNIEGDTESNIRVYTPSVLLRKGQIEIKNFNNVYTQTSFANGEGDEQELNERQTFFTGSFQFTFGSSKSGRFNVGFDVYLNAVGYKPINGADTEKYNRTAIGAIGPRIKVNPIKSLPTFSVQSALLFPAAKDLESPRFLAHDRTSWWTQFFFDKTFGDFQFFAEADFLIRFKRNDTQDNFFRTPVSLFVSYFPNEVLTLYAMIQHDPRFGKNPNNNDQLERLGWFTQAGVGAKYQLTPNLNLELLVTDFFAAQSEGLGSTYNLGLRFIR